MFSNNLKVIFPEEQVNVELNFQKYFTPQLPFSDSELYQVRILRSESLSFGDDVQRVYSLTLSREGITRSYSPGDTVGIFPTNDECLVEKVIVRLGLEPLADKTCHITVSPSAKKNFKIPQHLPQVSTVRNLLSKHLDLACPAKKLFLKSLIPYTTNETEVLHLQHLCCAEGSAAYGEFITKNGRTLTGILETFPSCKPTFEVLLEHLPSLKPRPYSISSSPLEEHLCITFFILVHEDGTRGTCTGWLEKLLFKNQLINQKNNDECSEKESAEICIPLYFRKPHCFHLPADESIPLLMIATGTGIAPFRGFLSHRMLQSKSHKEFGESWLFYGCRYSCRDFLYKNEITQYLRCGILKRLHVAFSREFRDKVYVQDKIEEYGAEVSELILEKRAVIYICGDARTMVKNVKSALITILIRFGHLEKMKATNYLKELENQHRCITDVWY